MRAYKRMLDINDELRLVLFGLESAMGVDLDLNEIARLFRGPAHGRYEFRRCRRAVVVGYVEEYEPGDILFEIATNLLAEERFDRILSNAKYHWLRWERQRDESEA